MLNILFHLFIILLFMFITIGSGLLICNYCKIKFKNIEQLFVLSFGFGVVVIIYSTIIMSALNQLNFIFILILCSILLLLIIFNIKLSSFKKIESIFGDSFKKSGFIYAIFIIAATYLLSAMAPLLDGDSIHTYLDLPKKYIYKGGLGSFSYELYNSGPLNMQMLSTFLLKVGGDIPAQVIVGFGMTLFSAFTIFIICEQFIDKETGVYAMLFFLSTNMVEFLVPGTKINPGRAYFDLLSIFSVLQFLFVDKCKSLKWLIIAGIFSGTAFGIHYSSGFMALCLFLFITYFLITSELDNLNKNVILYGCIFSSLILLFSSPWLIKNFIETNNPFYPAFGSIFSITENSITDALNQKNNESLNIFSMFWNISTGYTAGGYGKPIGPLFLCLIPGVLFLKNIPKPIIKGFIFFIILYFLWFYFGVKRPRHFISEIAILSILCGNLFFLSKKQFPRFFRIFSFMISILLVFNLSFYFRLHFIKTEKLQYILGLINREQFLARNMNVMSLAYPNIHLVNYINELADETTVVSLNVGSDFYIHPKINFIDSRMLNKNFFQNSFKNELDIIRSLKNVNADYLLINEKYLKKNIETIPNELIIINSTSFKKEYLLLVTSFDQQYLYKVNLNK